MFYDFWSIPSCSIIDTWNILKSLPLAGKIIALIFLVIVVVVFIIYSYIKYMNNKFM